MSPFQRQPDTLRHTVKLTVTTVVTGNIESNHIKGLQNLKYFTTCQVQCNCFQLIPLCPLHSGKTRLSNSTQMPLFKKDLLTEKEQREENVVAVLLGTVSPDIPFGADDSCSGRVACPRLNITQRACSRSRQQAELGFSTPHGECICHNPTHSERLESCTARESTRTRSFTLGLCPQNK